MAIAGQKVTRDFLELDPWHKFYLGLNYYYLHPYRRNAPEERVIWQKGSTRLLQIGGESHKNTLLMIPSLINKSYIFDLKENYSLARYLAKNSNILIMDWGDLTEEELAFDFSDYVTKRILPAIEFISHNHSNISLLGYCLGGIMAMAACFFAKNISSLILIATPWDFSSFKILDYPMDSSLSICSYAINLTRYLISSQTLQAWIRNRQKLSILSL